MHAPHVFHMWSLLEAGTVHHYLPHGQVQDLTTQSTGMLYKISVLHMQHKTQKCHHLHCIFLELNDKILAACSCHQRELRELAAYGLIIQSLTYSQFVVSSSAPPSVGCSSLCYIQLPFPFSPTGCGQPEYYHLTICLCKGMECIDVL